MSVTFPLALPSTPILAPDWRLVPGTRSITIGRRKAVAGVRVTLDQFVCDEVATRSLWHADKRAWEAFFAKLEGGFGSFTMAASHRPWPFAHPGGMAGFNGVRAISSWHSSGDLVITAPPANFTITEGDYIELQNGSARTVVIACDTSTSAASVTRQITVRGMFDQTTFPAGSAVRFYSPTALFRLTDYDLDIQAAGPTPVTFSAEQVLFP